MPINPAISRLTLAALVAAWSATSNGHADIDPPRVDVPDYQQGAQWLAQRLAQTREGNHARNLIFFLGDGMSITTLTASRIYQGQQEGHSGEENALSFERFPWSALVKTYNTDQQTPDSAGTMTALMTGVKTRAGMLSTGPEQDRAICAGASRHSLPTLLENASLAGMATGVITTARLTHATPAATYSHTPERDWEADTDLPEEARQNGCTDIARQLLENGFGQGLDIAMGGGLANFIPTDKGGKREDDDLTALFHQNYPQGQLLLSRNDLTAMNARTPILGLFAGSHMDYDHDRRQQPEPVQPSLEEMTFAAIRVLQEQTLGHEQGYVLVIEGARIDHAHHAGNAYRALSDTVEMARAVELADQLTDDSDTLIVVTADHSHTLSLAGYQKRGTPILGYANTSATYTSLGYANGPGANANNHDMAPEDPDYHQAALAPMESESHGSDDVAAHAKGPGSQWFHGQLEQNSLYHLMVQALQLPEKSRSTRNSEKQP
jgi:alkaline phosphatase